MLQILEGLLGFVERNWQFVVSAAGGTFFGAWSAFLLEKFHAARKDRESHHSALLYTQLVLLSMLNELMNLKEQALDRLRNDPERHLKLLPHKLDGNAWQIDRTVFQFLLLHKAERVAQDMIVAERRYRLVLGILERRYNAHLSLQDSLRSTDVTPVQDKQLGDLTDHLYRQCDDTIVTLQCRLKDLEQFIRRAFPKCNVLRIESAGGVPGQRS